MWLGLRAAAATAVPLIVAASIDPAAAAWAPLAGFTVALVDKGGAYRTRAIQMATVAIGGLLAVTLGSLIAGHGIYTGLAVAPILAICALGHAWPTLVSASNTIALHFLVASSLPDGALAPRLAGFAGGAIFALVLGLLVWPVRVYKPGRRAIANVATAIAAHARALSDGAEGWRDAAIKRHRSLRDTIEVARTVLLASRRGRRVESGRGARLLAMVQYADQLMGLLVALEEQLDVSGRAPGVAESLARLATDLDLAAARVLDEDPAPLPAGAALPAIDDPHVALLLARAHDDRVKIDALIDSLDADTAPALPNIEPDPPEPIGEQLREAISLVGRHAIRVAIVVWIAMSIARGLELSHRYWVALTAFLLLQPTGAATRIKAAQRVAGTLVGGALAALVPYVAGDPRVVMAIVVVLAGVSASVVSINYGLYAMFLTPTFVLLAESSAQDFHLVGVRIVNTLIAAAIVMIASLIFPGRLSKRVDGELGDAYLAAATFLEAALGAIVAQTPQPNLDVLAKRRAYGVAINRAEAAVEQLVTEGLPTEVVEPRMTQVLFLRRLAAAINAFGSTRGSGAYAAHGVEIAAFAAAATADLKSLARGTLAGRALVDRISTDPVVSARIGRIDGAIATLADAAARAR